LPKPHQPILDQSFVKELANLKNLRNFKIFLPRAQVIKLPIFGRYISAELLNFGINKKNQLLNASPKKSW
jgi:hypothetical protein